MTREISRAQLRDLRELMALDFTVLELGLYLNTHPDDRRALKDYNTLARRYQESKRAYQREYGPIIVGEESDLPWEYPRTPWPWQIEYQ
ncbi:spore coat protein CotJB [Halonatronum saccharophilum]|uniref:spore coat protein CotJB n=1 Tax=Halonatronum saccharophilum TaxID=150060 RepID=UPI000485D9C4|nr:spore coat protein CotJB [Halonatronum saccharophilum]